MKFTQTKNRNMFIKFEKELKNNELEKRRIKIKLF